MFIVVDLQGERSAHRYAWEENPNFRRPIVFNREQAANLVHIGIGMLLP